jgi:hypothetical protein
MCNNRTFGFSEKMRAIERMPKCTVKQMEQMEQTEARVAQQASHGDD